MESEQQIKDSLLAMEFIEEDINLGLKHAEQKNLEGVINWIGMYQDDPTIVEKKDTKMEVEKEGEGEQVQPQQMEEEKKEEEVKEEEVKPEVPEEPKGKPISGMVNQDLVKQLQMLSYSKNVSEKALFLTQAKDVSPALDWINEHMNDADYEEPLLMVGQSGKGKLPQGKPKLSNYTKEEAREIAKEMQKQIRERQNKRAIKDKQEREKLRVINTKLMRQNQEKQKIVKEKAQLDATRKERAKYKILKKEKQIELRKEKARRQGKEYVEEKENPMQIVERGIRAVSKVYPYYKHKEGKRLMKTLQIYITNILKDPTDDKFRKINKQNKAFQKRIGKVIGGDFMMKAIGFFDEDDFYVMHKPDLDTLKLMKDRIQRECK